MLSTDRAQLPCRLVHATEDFLVVDKPAGISVHREPGQPSLLEQLKATRGLTYLAPVHRLDRATSGLWLLACNPRAAASLGEQFARRSVEKYYLALSDRKPRKKQGRVEGALLKSRGGSYRLARQGEPWSATRFFSYGLGGGLRLYLLKPATGRTHQLRVVMKSLGAPILGDRRYYGHGVEADAAPDRCYLHAYGLRFEHGGETLSLLCPPAQGVYFTSAACRARLRELAEPWSLPWPAGRAADDRVER